MPISESNATVAVPRSLTIAVVGNPNCGKTSLFNRLTGYHQRIGNYPGTTVERKTGRMRGTTDDIEIQLVDLPGTYSIAPHSRDEAIVLDVLLGHVTDVGKPDAILAVVDATNLARHLFLVSQILELGRPVVVALNMIDLARRAGIEIDRPKLEQMLGVPVVEVIATRGTGIDALRDAILAAPQQPLNGHCPSFPSCVCCELDGLERSVNQDVPIDGSVKRLELLQTLLGPGGYHEQRLVARCGRSLADELSQRRGRIEAGGESLAEVEGKIRYAWIDRVVRETVRKKKAPRRSRSEKVDRVLTHPVAGMLVLLLVMAGAFQAIYTWAGPVMDLIDATFVALGGLLTSALPDGALRSLLADGVIAGAGAVLVFLPQILILFLFIGIMEDCGYMARAAFLFDRWMSRMGLSGKSFIPLLSSFACAVPGIMSTRTIENSRDRFLTILIAPLMSCSARLPVYTLLIGAFVPAGAVLGGWVNLQAMTMLGMYLVGALVAIPIALLLKATVLRGPAQPFLMELPPYRWPCAKTVLFRMYEQGREFTKTAGTMILAVTIVIWALGYYPRPAAIAAEYEALRIQAGAEASAAGDEADLQARLDELDQEEAGAYLRQSVLGRLGRVIEPVVKPLGWDWRIGTAVIASFPAREVVIATLGTIYNLGEEQDETSADLRQRLREAKWPGPEGRAVFNLPVALSVMVFFALCCQCGATLVVIRRETHSWRWPLITFCYMTALAYVGAFIVYQASSRLLG